MAITLRGKGVKTKLLSPHDLAWDVRLGIQTFGYSEVGGHDRSQYHWYVPAAYSDLFRLFKTANLSPADVFVDVGAGLGRGVFVANWLGAARSVGIELQQELVEQAEENRRTSRIDTTNVAFAGADATEYCVPDVSVLYMFNPFGPDIMARMLETLRARRSAARTAPLRIIYLNPRFEQVLGDSGWLRKTAHLPQRPRRLSILPRFAGSIWQEI